jgi:acetoin utilization deacetylase AcuC-like enzyme
MRKEHSRNLPNLSKRDEFKPMSTLYLTHPVFKNHDTGSGHPERPDRMRAIDAVMAHEIFNDLVREEAPKSDFEVLKLVHPSGYIEGIREAAPERGLIYLDGDTVMSPGSLEAGLRAVGAGLRAVDAVMTGEARNAFCAVRPCGHHAEPSRAMGFCFFANVAIAGKYAREKHGAERIAVVDFDVHHGNGTQAAYWNDKDLFFASTHQMPLYPGTGALNETGVAGNIVNAPLRAGDGGEKFKQAFEERVLPELRNFRPDIVLISAGFDAHRNDPLASLELVEEDFGWATAKLLEIAEETAGGRVVSMLEGGYDLRGLAGSVAAHVKRLMEASR